MPENSTPFQPDDYFRLRFLQDAALSPDGQSVVYTVLHTDTAVEPPVDRKTIYLQHIHDGYTKQLTSGTRLDHSPAWSPDGAQIAFVSDRAEKPQIFVLPVDGGEARQLTTLPNGVGGGPVWSPDSQTIASPPRPRTRQPIRPHPIASPGPSTALTGWGARIAATRMCGL